MAIYYIILAIIAIVIGFFAGHVMNNRLISKEKGKSLKTAKEVLKQAEEKANNTVKKATLEAQEKSNSYRLEIEKEIKKRRLELQRQEERLLKREESLDRKDNVFDNRSTALQRKEDKLNEDKENLLKQQEEANKLVEKRQKEVEKAARLSRPEAKELVLNETKKELASDRATLIKNSYEDTKREVNKKAKELIVNAIQRSSADLVSESTVSVVSLPNDEMKGRIIGREGRNIRTFENLTGIDLVIDDTPKVVILSGFNPLRREIAKMTLEELIKDGRIHPARIEELVKKSKEELNEKIQETGEEVIFKLGIQSMNPELVKLLGKLKYKLAYGQSVLNRSLQIAELAGTFAAEIGEDVTLAKRAGLLHDIGESVGNNEESHVKLGAEIAKKYGEDPVVIDAIESGDINHDSHYLISKLVQVASKISLARPGEQKHSLENYVRRLEKLERISNKFKGVEKSYAIQAGHEIQVFVKPEEISDTDAIILSQRIKNKIERDLKSTGQVKVSVIREVRSVKYAR